MSETDKNELELIPVKENELAELASMAHEIWHDYYTSIIGKEQIDYMLERFYSFEALSKQIQENQQFRFIVANGKKSGFISSTLKENCECFIHKFYIKTEIQSQSLGTRVMDLIKTEIAGKYCAETIFRLTVNRQNFKAINFYFKNGFKIESVADFDIGNGYFMNDFVMVMKSKTQ